jgi:hypothetical protein
LHRPIDQDLVHGFSLGRFPTADGWIVDVRVPRQQWDAGFTAGHPKLFAEHAVYQALLDHWQGREGEARRRILEIMRENRNAQDRMFWDRHCDPF